MEHGGDRHRRQPAARVMGQSPVSYGGWLAELAGYGRAEVRDYASLKEAPVGQTIAFRGLLGWAFRPRNFMKNPGRLGGFPDVRVVLRTCLRPGPVDRRQKTIVCPTVYRIPRPLTR